ncbi:hypothetical protein HHI36_023434 [Cryptolaemus montrouzieri]|uniref:Uncharacterized protein n=1 Tax=Cryptolaemus montrouzieri TaxID=559131 RepID=A0ABD2PH72_9CUCU
MDFVSIDGKQYIGEEIHQLFLEREEDGDFSDTSTINSDHDLEEEYSIDEDVTVETEPDPNDGFDGDTKDAATNPVQLGKSLIEPHTRRMNDGMNEGMMLSSPQYAACVPNTSVGSTVHLPYCVKDDVLQTLWHVFLFDKVFCGFLKK